MPSGVSEFGEPFDHVFPGVDGGPLVHQILLSGDGSVDELDDLDFQSLRPSDLLHGIAQTGYLGCPR